MGPSRYQPYFRAGTLHGCARSWTLCLSIAIGCASPDSPPVAAEDDTSDVREVPAARQMGADAAVGRALDAATGSAPRGLDASVPTPGRDASAPAPSCSASTRWRAGDTSLTMRVGNTDRRYVLHVPASYRGDRPVPLLIDLHPLFGSAMGQRQSSGYAAIADREGFIIAYPDGVVGGFGTAWNVGPCCSGGDDVAFVRALVDKIKGEGCIDDKRVYAAGYSMGGGMSHYLACNAGDVFAAVSPAAFDLLVEAEQTCKPSRPISVISFRGTADAIVPFGGGASTPPNGWNGGTTIHFEGAEKTFQRWAAYNGCTGEPSASGGNCRSYTSCRGGVETTLCTAQGGGHVTGDATVGWARLSKYTLP